MVAQKRLCTAKQCTTAGAVDRQEPARLLRRYLQRFPGKIWGGRFSRYVSGDHAHRKSCALSTSRGSAHGDVVVLSFSFLFFPSPALGNLFHPTPHTTKRGESREEEKLARQVRAGDWCALLLETCFVISKPSRAVLALPGARQTTVCLVDVWTHHPTLAENNTAWRRKREG